VKGDSDRLVKALIKQRKRCYVTSRHVQIAAAVLRADGVEEALAYVKDLPDSTPSPEAAFEFYLDNQPTTGGRDLDGTLDKERGEANGMGIN